MIILNYRKLAHGIDDTLLDMSGRHLDSNRSQPRVGTSNGRTALSRLVLIGSGSATTER
jgi:hypothetical protein